MIEDLQEGAGVLGHASPRAASGLGLRLGQRGSAAAARPGRNVSPAPIMWHLDHPHAYAFNAVQPWLHGERLKDAVL